MALRLDQLPQETQRQVLAALEQQGQLILDDGSHLATRERYGHSVPVRTAAIVLAYAALAVGLCFLAFGQASAPQGYPEFFARVVVYVARESWAIVRENAVPLSGNLVIITVFALGLFQAAKLAVWIVRKLWPVVLTFAGLALALIVLKIQAA